MVQELYAARLKTARLYIAARSLKSTTTQPAVGGPKTFWEDQRAWRPKNLAAQRAEGTKVRGLYYFQKLNFLQKLISEVGIFYKEAMCIFYKKVVFFIKSGVFR